MYNKKIKKFNVPKKLYDLGLYLDKKVEKYLKNMNLTKQFHLMGILHGK